MKIYIVKVFDAGEITFRYSTSNKEKACKIAETFALVWDGVIAKVVEEKEVVLAEYGHKITTCSKKQ